LAPSHRPPAPQSRSHCGNGHRGTCHVNKPHFVPTVAVCGEAAAAPQCTLTTAQRILSTGCLPSDFMISRRRVFGLSRCPTGRIDGPTSAKQSAIDRLGHGQHILSPLADNAKRCGVQLRCAPRAVGSTEHGLVIPMR
jgi:hypothetical protein